MVEQPEILFLESEEARDSLLPMLGKLDIEINGPLHRSREIFKIARKSRPALVLAHFNGHVPDEELSTLGKVQKMTSAPVILVTSIEATLPAPEGLTIARRFRAPVDAESLRSAVEEILERRKLEAENISLRRLTAQLADASPHPIVRTDTAGRILYANEAATHLWRFHSRASPECLNAAARFPLRDPATAARIESWPEAFVVNTAPGTHALALLEAGQDRAAAIRLRLYPRPLASDSGIVLGYVFHIALDALNPADDESLMPAGTEAMSQIIGGLAHDFNNLLGVVSAYADLLVDQLPENASTHRYARQIQTSVEKGTRLLKTFSQLSKEDSSGLRLLSLPELIEDIETLLKRVIGGRIRLEHDFAEDASSIHADPVFIERSLINLLLNARDAIEGEGTISIRLERALIEPGSIPKCSAQAGPYILMTIADTGCGIPENLLSRIFDPFFTTKPPGEGTGLGLASVRAGLRKCGGFVTAKSQVGEGTEFRLYFPCPQEQKVFDESR